MDDIDEKLLSALRENGRASTAMLARLVGRSRTSVQSRIERLEKQGIIVGYGVRLAPELGLGAVRAHVMVKVGPKEARAWTVRRNAKGPEAAGVIHGDFERGFIRAETISYDDFVACNGEQGAKDAGKMRSEGKDYVVQDGDVMHFRFNV